MQSQQNVRKSGMLNVTRIMECNFLSNQERTIWQLGGVKYVHVYG